MQLMGYLCVKMVLHTNILVEQYARMHIFFRNDQGVRFLEHVPKLKQIWYYHIFSTVKYLLYFWFVRFIFVPFKITYIV